MKKLPPTGITTSGGGMLVSADNETDSALGFAKDCGYITDAQHAELTALCTEVGKMLGSLINDPTPFLISDR